MRVQSLKRRVSQFVSSGDCMSPGLCILRFGDLTGEVKRKKTIMKKSNEEWLQYSSEFSSN